MTEPGEIAAAAETARILAVDDPEVAARSLESGAHGYLVKPFWPGQLLIAAANALRQHQLELAERAPTGPRSRRRRRPS